MLFFKKRSNIPTKPNIEPTDVQLQILRQLSTVEEMLQKSLKRQRKVESAVDSINEMIEEHTDSFLTQEGIISKESVLIAVLMEQDEYLYRLARLTPQSSISTTFVEQIESIRQIAQQKLKPFNFFVISDTHVPIDYQVHEIIDVMPTENINNKDTVYQIVTPGYTHNGKLIKKATIIAYKYEEGNK